MKTLMKFLVVAVVVYYGIGLIMGIPILAAFAWVWAINSTVKDLKAKK